MVGTMMGESAALACKGLPHVAMPAGKCGGTAFGIARGP